VTRLSTPIDGINRSRLLATHKTIVASCASRIRSASSSSGECHPLTKATCFKDTNCFNRCEVFDARSESIWRAEIIPRSGWFNKPGSPTPQSLGRLPRKNPSTPFGSVTSKISHVFNFRDLRVICFDFVAAMPCCPFVLSFTALACFPALFLINSDPPNHPA
jgi:hypothetical protein